MTEETCHLRIPLKTLLASQESLPVPCLVVSTQSKPFLWYHLCILVVWDFLSSTGLKIIELVCWVTKAFCPTHSRHYNKLHFPHLHRRGVPCPLVSRGGEDFSCMCDWLLLCFSFSRDREPRPAFSETFPFLPSIFLCTLIVNWCLQMKMVTWEGLISLQLALLQVTLLSNWQNKSTPPTPHIKILGNI